MNGVEAMTKRTATPQREVAYYVVAAGAMLFGLAVPVAAASLDLSPIAAWVLTFLPGMAVVCQAARFRDPAQALPFMIYSMMVRIVAAFVGGLLVIWLIPAIPQTPFLLWLAGMYGVALAVEVYLTVSCDGPRTALASGPAVVELREAGR